MMAMQFKKKLSTLNKILQCLAKNEKFYYEEKQNCISKKFIHFLKLEVLTKNFFPISFELNNLQIQKPAAFFCGK